ncbi:hypothetical protein [Paenibacillus solanacearum]|uniref:hypothetical protein n=1 Tax=Paenibacillus solanacearum TaxID=2048548 RepID=UPI001C40470A|nr:hypothetical protein [Paenibacillus solanacearum]
MDEHGRHETVGSRRRARAMPKGEAMAARGRRQTRGGSVLAAVKMAEAVIERGSCQTVRKQPGGWRR